MENLKAVKNISKQIMSVAETIISVSDGVEQNDRIQYDLEEVYDGIILDQISNMQMLVLELSRAVKDEVTDEQETVTEIDMNMNVNTVEQKEV